MFSTHLGCVPETTKTRVVNFRKRYEKTIQYVEREMLSIVVSTTLSRNGTALQAVQSA